MTKAEEKDTVYYGVEEAREAGKQKKYIRVGRNVPFFSAKVRDGSIS